MARTSGDNLAKIGGVAISLGQKVMSSSLPVVIASDQSALPVTLDTSLLATESTQSAGNVLLGAVTETAPATDTASSGLNGRLQRIAQRITSLIALLPTALGQGTMATSFKVVLPSDQTSVPVAATLGAETTKVIGTINIAASQSLNVGGLAAAGAGVSGNPLRNGGLGRTTLPASVSSAQMVDILLDRYGRVYTVAPVCSNATSNGTPITTNTNTQIVAAPAASNHLRIHRLWAQNSSATGTWCYWGNGSGVKTIPFYLAQYQPFSMNEEGRWELSTATGLFLNTATTGANIEWFVEYETLAD